VERGIAREEPRQPPIRDGSADVIRRGAPMKTTPPSHIPKCGPAEWADQEPGFTSPGDPGTREITNKVPG
jgi:hypothetical protein